MVSTQFWGLFLHWHWKRWVCGSLWNVVYIQGLRLQGNSLVHHCLGYNLRFYKDGVSIRANPSLLALKRECVTKEQNQNQCLVFPTKGSPVRMELTFAQVFGVGPHPSFFISIYLYWPKHRPRRKKKSMSIVGSDQYRQTGLTAFRLWQKTACGVREVSGSKFTIMKQPGRFSSKAWVPGKWFQINSTWIHPHPTTWVTCLCPGEKKPCVPGLIKLSKLCKAPESTQSLAEVVWQFCILTTC